MKTSTIRPGLLVSLKTSITGGVNYQRIDLDAQKEIEGATVTRWETTKVVEDPGEFDRAVKVRGKCRSLITAVCTASDFGLLCPTLRESDLASAIEEAKKLAAAHNAGAVRSFVSVYAITGRVASDDAEAARAIGSEVRGLLEEMRNGVAKADVETIRAAANRARSLGMMLTDDAQAKVGSAIAQARAAAREIVKRVRGESEEAAKVIMEIKVDEIEKARMSFLDLDGEKPIESMPIAAPAALDMEVH